MAVDHEVASAPVDRSLLPRTATVNEEGHLCVAGIDLLELAVEFGTPLFVYDEEHLRRACRDAVAAWGDSGAPTPPRRSSVACHGPLGTRGGDAPRCRGPRVARCIVALTAGVPADRLVLHGNNKSVDELATALQVGVGRIVVDSFDEIARLGVRCPQGRVGPGSECGTAPGPGSRHAGGRSGTPTCSSAPGRRTRSSASRCSLGRGGAEAVRPRWKLAMPGVELVGVHGAHRKSPGL